jgi:predicted outer membrane repeat protein
VTVPFTINVASTAVDPDDYSITASPLTITAGSTTADITITVATDSLDENDETVIVDMGTPTNATQGTTTTHTATITDDDATPTVTLTNASQATAGESGTAVITAELSAASGLEVTVPFSVNGTSTAVDPDDYSITASPVIIPVGITTADITVTITEDTYIEGDETVIVDIGTPTNATQGATTTHTLTITDDEALPVVDFTAASQSVAEDAGTVTVTATLDVASSLDVTVPFTVSGTAEGSGSDHDLTDGNIIITAGQLTGTKDFTVNNDSLDEPDEAVILTMGTPVNGTAGPVTVHTVTITDNDAMPSVEFTLATQATAGESGIATITAELSAASGFNVTVPFTVNGSSTADGGGTDYSITASPVIITAGNTTADITVTITTDSDIEGDETVIVDMGSPTNAAQGTTTTHIMTITDDDSAGGITYTVCKATHADDPCDYLSINAGIDDALVVNGDTLLVSDDIYSENINFDGKYITIKSKVDAASTTIQGDGSNAPVVIFSGAETSSTVLDGFTIDNVATANNSTRGISITNSAAPTLKNLIVKGNNTTTSWVDGSGIYIDGGGATIEGGTIGDATLQNTCDDGCGIYATALSAPLSIDGTTFTRNTGGANTSGAGIALVNNGTQTTTISNATFSYNSSADSGGAIYLDGSKISISGSTINNNSVTDSGMHGGAIYSTGAASSITISSTDFTANTTTSNGGAIYITGSTEATPLSITGGTFTGSGGLDAGSLGGAIYLGSMTNQSLIDGVTFTGLQGQKGGAIYTQGALKIQNNSLIYSNTSTLDGGGIRVDGANAALVLDSSSVYSNTGTIAGGILVENSGSATIQNGSDIYSNEATGTLGGGIYNTTSGTVTITASTIRGNKAKQHGGASTWENGGGINNAGTITIMNSTIAGNHGPNGGGLNTTGTATVTNSIFWDNSGNSGKEEINGTAAVTYSDVEGSYTGTGNINLDPVFVTPAQASSGTPTPAGDFHIQSGSNVVDQGTGTGAPADDIDGDSRPLGSGIDMGADEKE